jgi:hypothetical protein
MALVIGDGALGWVDRVAASVSVLNAVLEVTASPMCWDSRRA